MVRRAFTGWRGWVWGLLGIVAVATGWYVQQVPPPATIPLDDEQQSLVLAYEPRYSFLEILALGLFEKALARSDPDRFLEAVCILYQDESAPYIEQQHIPRLVRLYTGPPDYYTDSADVAHVAFRRNALQDTPDQQISIIAAATGRRFAIAHPEKAASWLIRHNTVNRLFGEPELPLAAISGKLRERDERLVPFADALQVDIQPIAERWLADFNARND